MNLELKEDKFHIRAYFASCACKCKFCCLGEYEKSKKITFTEYEAILKKFTDVEKKYGMRLRSFIYNCPEHQYLKEQIQLYESLGMERNEFKQIDLNGTKIKDKNEIKIWFDKLQNAGVEKVAFSWFGTEETHDAFVNRKGYFEYLVNCLMEAKSRNIPVTNKVFLHKGIISDVDNLINFLADKSDVIISAFMEYSGNAKNMADEFITEEDFTLFSDTVKDTMSNRYLEKFKTEREWYELAIAGGFPQFNIVDYILYIDGDNYLDFYNKSTDETIQYFRDFNSSFQSSIGEISDLAKKYAEPDCSILYECRDVLRKWIDKFYSKNNLDLNDLFSFTHNCVEWKVYERL